MSNLKKIIFDHLIKALELKIKEVNDTLDSAKTAKEGETKSSAGDKYETSREMIQFEQDKAMGQLGKLKQQLHELNKINPILAHKMVQFGSLIQCNTGNYFISIPFGKIEIGGKEFFAISMASPIGQQLLGKKIGAEFEIGGNKLLIRNIL